ncbi:XTP/dITP diphosphatase [bacterium]|nr:XTP/dITP diphosphatase [bacterium]
MPIVVGTRNRGKLREMQYLFKQFLPRLKNVQVTGLNAFPPMPAIAEDGASFHENARKKALAVAEHTGCMTIADDSGLEVDALNGAPGILSARYAGEHARDEDNNRKLLDALAGVPAHQRGAQFVCALAVALPGDLLGIFEGVCRGVIGTEPHGGSGFGYDPLFIRTDVGKTFAEMPQEIKNRISHRARAFEKAALIIVRYVDQQLTK